MKGRRRSPLWFFLLIFALSAPIWILGETAGWPAVEQPFNLPLSSLTGFCPLIAALILLAPRERRFLLKRLLTGIKPRSWYVPVLLLMPVLMALSYATLLLSGRPVPAPHTPLITILVLSVVFFIEAIGEEAGWMGYAAGPMRERWSALTTALLLGTVWAVWHIVPWIQAHHTATWIAWKILGTAATRVLIVWVYSNTGRSVLAATLFHASDNMSYAMFPVDGSYYDPASASPIIAVAALVVTFLWGGATLSHYNGRRILSRVFVKDLGRNRKRTLDPGPRPENGGLLG